jgi:hypothetical protein
MPAMDDLDREPVPAHQDPQDGAGDCVRANYTDRMVIYSEHYAPWDATLFDSSTFISEESLRRVRFRMAAYDDELQPVQQSPRRADPPAPPTLADHSELHQTPRGLTSHAARGPDGDQLPGQCGATARRRGACPTRGPHSEAGVRCRADPSATLAAGHPARAVLGPVRGSPPGGGLPFSARGHAAAAGATGAGTVRLLMAQAAPGRGGAFTWGSASPQPSAMVTASS